MAAISIGTVCTLCAAAVPLVAAAAPICAAAVTACAPIALELTKSAMASGGGSPKPLSTKLTPK